MRKLILGFIFWCVWASCGAATFGTLSSNTDTDTVIITGSAHLHLSGTFGGGSLTVYFLSADGVTWRAIKDAVYAAATDDIIEFPNQSTHRLKGTLTGSTSPSLVWEFTGYKARNP